MKVDPRFVLWIRQRAWRLLGPVPEHYLRSVTDFSPIDTVAPRRTMIDNAVTIVQHNTREAIKTDQIGRPGSLLGDYLEFGVYRGDTFVHAYRRASAAMPFMRFWAFDSFEGLPQLTGLDLGGEFHAAQFACDIETFEETLRRENVDMRRVEIVSGWFDKSLVPELKNNRRLTVASLVYVDADLYASTVPVLNFLTDIVSTGTIIMFDDWYCFSGDPNKGVQRAWREWLARNRNIIPQDFHVFGPYGKSFILAKTCDNGLK
jgi:O-methyltransferase